MFDRFTSALFVALNDDPDPPERLGDAVEFARAAGLSMTLFDALVPISRVQQQLRIGNRRITEAHDASQVRGEQLRDWADQHRARLRMGQVVSCGRRAVEVAHRVAAANHDLVVVAPDDSDNDLVAVRRLIRVSPCAVLVLRRPIMSGSVIAAVDPDDRVALNDMILRSAAAIACIGQRPVHLVHAYQPHGLDRIRNSRVDDFDEEDIEAFVDDVRDAHRRAVDELVAQVGRSATVTVHVDVGTPLEVITRTVVETDASIITVGTGGRRGMSAMLMGTTADRAITHTSASVLVVKAPGFVPLLDDNVARWTRSASGPSAVVTTSLGLRTSTERRP